MIRVLLVDDQVLVRSGFRVILESQPDIEVVGEAADGAQAVELAAAQTPDVICMDVEMPVMNGLEATRRILGSVRVNVDTSACGTAEATGPAVLVLTTFGHEEYLFEALDAGVSGFLLKTSRAEQLIDAVRALAAGDALLGPDVTRAVMQRAAQLAQHASRPPAEHPANADAASDTVTDTMSHAVTGTRTGSTVPTEVSRSGAAMDTAGLTEREREVLLLVASGKSNAEIAGELFLGEATVKTHVSNLLQKIGVRDRVKLVVWAHAHGAV